MEFYNIACEFFSSMTNEELFLFSIKFGYGFIIISFLLQRAYIAIYENYFDK